MKGDAKSLAKFLGNNKGFQIPMYQRAYSWREEQCQKLFEDIESTVESNKATHFFGSIVSVPEADALIVIDGQQRLTTISLLLLALKYAIDSGTKSAQKSNTSSFLYEEFLINKWEDNASKLRLRHIPGDAEAFAALFESDSPNIDSKIVQNFHLFQDYISRTSLTADQIIEGIKRLFIIDISIDYADNPQLVFESINSTGLDLTEGDKIRNYVLMDLENKNQSSYYTKYWKKIEELTYRGENQDGVGLFVRDFLTAVSAKIPNLDKIHTEFKIFCLENPDLFEVREELFQKLLIYAQNYHYLLYPQNVAIKEIGRAICNINRQEISPSYPFLLEVFGLWTSKKISDNQVIDILNIIDSFVFRRQMCDLPTNSLNKIFTELHKSIIKLDLAVPYEERLKRVLIDKTGKARFPSDIEFRQAMIDKRVYEMRSKNRAYLFARLENGLNLNAQVSGCNDAVYNMIVDKDYTIEHIMPQSLNPAWKRDLGEEWDIVHETWLHRLGNLTLTAYNSKLSNKTFKSKIGRNFQQIIEDDFGFATSAHHLWLNEFLGQQKTWTKEEIKQRSDLLAERALIIWPMIATTFKKIVASEVFSLRNNSPEIFTGSKPVEFTIDNNTIAVSSWVDLYMQAILYLYQLNPSLIDGYAKSKENKGLFGYFRTSESLRYKFIAKNVYLLTHSSTWDKHKILNLLFDIYDIGDVTVKLMNKQDDQDDSEEPEGRCNSSTEPFLDTLFENKGNETKL